MRAGQPRSLDTLRRSLPEGTFTVGVGLAISGLATYGFLVVTARAVGPDRYAGISVLWAATVLAALGVFLPIEQEVARAVAARRVNGQGARPVVVRAGQIGAAMVVALLLASAAAFGVIRKEMFDGNAALAASLLTSFIAYWLVHLTRGLTAGEGRFGAYASLLGGEAAVRLLGCGVLAAAGVHTAGPYGVVLAVSPLVAVAAVVAGSRHRLEDGPAAPRPEVSRALGRLVAAAVLAQLLVNGPPLAVKLLARADEHAVAGRFLAGLIVVRVPLFLFAAIQAALLPRLSALVGERRMHDFRVLVARLLALVAGVGVIATAAAALAGPPVVRMLFGHGFVLARTDLTLLAAASALYMVTLVLAQALIALTAHARVAVGWLAGVVVFVGTLMHHAALVRRVDVAFVVGTVAATATMALLLRAVMRDVHPDPSVAGLGQPSVSP